MKEIRIVQRMKSNLDWTRLISSKIQNFCTNKRIFHVLILHHFHSHFVGQICRKILSIIQLGNIRFGLSNYKRKKERKKK